MSVYIGDQNIYMLYFESDSKLYNSMGKFSMEKFPDASPIEHLLKVKNEADEAINCPHDIVEYADILLSLFGAAYKAGFSYEELMKASKKKLEICKERKWRKLEDGTYQHIKNI